MKDTLIVMIEFSRDRKCPVYVGTIEDAIVLTIILDKFRYRSHIVYSSERSTFEEEYKHVLDKYRTGSEKPKNYDKLVELATKVITDNVECELDYIGL